MPVDIEDCRDAMRILHETIFEPESDQTLWECFADALEEEEISADELLDFYDDVRSSANAGVHGDSIAPMQLDSSDLQVAPYDDLHDALYMTIRSYYKSVGAADPEAAMKRLMESHRS